MRGSTDRSAGGAKLFYHCSERPQHTTFLSVECVDSPERRARHRYLTKESRLTKAKHTSMRVRGPHLFPDSSLVRHRVRLRGEVGSIPAPGAMGTNFYTDNGTHVGKRSASGKYCYRCKASLCLSGEQAVHQGRFGDWPEDGLCARCHKSDQVRGSCSFTWAMRPEILHHLAEIAGQTTEFYDEYGDSLTGDEMKSTIDKCPIKFIDLIGTGFS